MGCLKNSHFLLYILSFLVCGCAGPSYKVLHQGRLAVELQVSPDRVLLECEYQYDNDMKNLYGFMMHILDDENTVLSISQFNFLDKESCYKRISKIGEILKTGKQIYIGGMGDLTEPRIQQERQYVFPGKGTFFYNNRVLQFMVIANEHGLCFDAFSGAEKPCPRDPFPIKK
ncbi:MAG: hypothetical protein A2381_18085 [Bdellovibrionales bacterium RIFOXYB1_FULL_37_110]|nr:MAG: hypothetical protein A2417_06550 [Bdellovibrionales bacterium RIFOXYC1_FULL_37_79]OFZ58583.1 MAG: hypothetical protein A2381_18085 [Bdellovibrionales bacterium RIFOXYB1_FULL_37_110]OFZ61755.1 MAG: hypothetical protein A2577_19605 [Bdellovibrionales bacterium RIFOXYD1_FULL_36_51]